MKSTPKLFFNLLPIIFIVNVTRLVFPLDYLLSLFDFAITANPATIIVTPPIITVKPENLCFGMALTKFMPG